MLNIQPCIEIIANHSLRVSPVLGYHYKMYLCLDSKLLGMYHTLSENPLMGMIEPFNVVCMDELLKVVLKCRVLS